MKATGTARPKQAARVSRIIPMSLRFAGALACEFVAATFILAAQPAFSETVKLTSGTAIHLELQHHVTSAYTPVGTQIQFRVADDLVTDGAVTIHKGTPVTGRMRQADDRAMLGTSGSMTIGIDFVTAVDGQQIRVVASETRGGRDRGNALAGWTIFWGLPGLMTRGVHSYLVRGTILEALVLFDRRIEVGVSPPVDTNPVAVPITGRIARHRFMVSRADPFRLDMERDKELKSVDFIVELPDGRILGDWTMELVAVDEIPIADAVRATAFKADAATFDSWSILKYCRHGTTALRFRAKASTGEEYELEYGLNVQFAGND